MQDYLKHKQYETIYFNVVLNVDYVQLTYMC